MSYLRHMSRESVAGRATPGKSAVENPLESAGGIPHRRIHVRNEIGARNGAPTECTFDLVGQGIQRPANVIMQRTNALKCV